MPQPKDFEVLVVDMTVAKIAKIEKRKTPMCLRNPKAEVDMVHPVLFHHYVASEHSQTALAASPTQTEDHRFGRCSEHPHSVDKPQSSW